MFIVAVVFFVIVFAWQIIRVRQQKHYARFDELFPDYQYDMKRLLMRRWMKNLCTYQRRNLVCGTEFR